MRLGIDPGEARIGVARCDPSGILATPVETVPRGAGDLARLVELVAEHAAVEVVVGYPRSLSGRPGPAAERSRAFAGDLADALSQATDQLAAAGAVVPGIRLVDERLTTVTAEAQLRSRGKKGAARRAIVDQAAAVLILQHALDSERASMRAPGELVWPAGPGAAHGGEWPDATIGADGVEAEGTDQ
ncbi:MAG: Holliday junction resolvase RuvX [Nocardioides sp.]